MADEEKQSIGWSLISIQLALFFKNQISKDFDEISVGIKKTGVVNNATSSIFPVPPVKIANIHIPILELRSSDSSFNVNVAYKRADLVYNSPAEGTTLESIAVELENKISLFAKYFTSEDFPSVSRVGFVANFFTPDRGSEEISKLIKKKFSSKPAEVNLRWNIVEMIGSYKSNNISKLDVVHRLETNEEGLQIQRDINTTAEQEIELILSSQQISAYVKQCLSLLTPEQLEDLITYDQAA